jgi:hypothetical protein
MRRELRAIHAHGEPADPYEWSHAPGGLWFWARDKVLGALLDRGLVFEDADGAWRLTDAGRAALGVTPIAGQFPLHAVRAILHAAHFRTMAGERVYIAALGNGNVIAWSS